MKYSEIASLNASELRKRLRQLKQELFDSRMKLNMKRLPNPLVIRFLRRDAARLHTALSKNQRKEKNKSENKNA